MSHNGMASIQFLKDQLFNTTHIAFSVQDMKAWRGVEV